jgi:hypothetical protein
MALKIGSEDRKKVMIAGGLGLVVLLLAIRMIFDSFGGSTPPPAAAPAAAPAIASAPATPARRMPVAREKTLPIPGGAHEAAKLPGSMAALDPTLHPEWMAQAESIEYTGKGRNIFSMSSAPAVIEQPHGPIRPQQMMAQAPTGPPPPPPITLKFFGYEAHQAGTRRAFLLSGDDVFIAAEGDVVDHRYRVVKIAPASIEVEDIPYKNTQSLPLVQN